MNLQASIDRYPDICVGRSARWSDAIAPQASDSKKAPPDEIGGEALRLEGKCSNATLECPAVLSRSYFKSNCRGILSRPLSAANLAAPSKEPDQGDKAARNYREKGKREAVAAQPRDRTLLAFLGISGVIVD